MCLGEFQQGPGIGVYLRPPKPTQRLLLPDPCPVTRPCSGPLPAQRPTLPGCVGRPWGQATRAAARERPDLCARVRLGRRQRHLKPLLVNSNSEVRSYREEVSNCWLTCGKIRTKPRGPFVWGSSGARRGPVARWEVAHPGRPSLMKPHES